jgi:hypothetical protein
MHLARVLGVASRRTEAAEEVGVLYGFLLGLNYHETILHWDPWHGIKSLYAVLSA